LAFVKEGWKTVTKKRTEKRIPGLMNNEEVSAFFGKGCCKNVRVQSGREKED
jgi:hypothetical protein